MDENDFEGRLANHLARGDISEEEHANALADARAATDEGSAVFRAAALGDGVMQIYLEFLRTPEMRAALEEWARANHKSS